MKNPRALVAVPYHEQKRYCLPQLFDSLNAIATSAKESHIDVEIVTRHDTNPFGQKDNVKLQRNFFRKLAMSYGVDYLFFHGADTVPPADILSRLIATGKHVVSGVYWQRGEKKAVNAITWKGTDPDAKNELMRTPGDELIEVDGFGLDCCLITKEVFEQISFMSWQVNDDDYPFCDRAKALGYPLHILRSAQCLHWSSDREYSFMGKHFEL